MSYHKVDNTTRLDRIRMPYEFSAMTSEGEAKVIVSVFGKRDYQWYCPVLDASSLVDGRSTLGNLREIIRDY